MSFRECLELYQQYGDDHYLIGENITQLQHALQAAHIAKICDAPDYVVIGLLLHDIGQLVGRRTKHDISIDQLHATHDDLGATWLQIRGFSSYVSDIAKYHTQAKILLCERDPSYLEQLSLASQQSYIIQKQKYQGSTPPDNIEVLMVCRLIDDMAKISNFTPGSLDTYESMYYRANAQNSITNGEEWISIVRELFQLQKSDYSKFLQRVCS